MGGLVLGPCRTGTFPLARIVGKREDVRWEVGWSVV
jgi:hypothetical protein